MMIRSFLWLFLIGSCSLSFGQVGPDITSWLQNTTVTGSYYMQGNSVAQPNNILVNCQSVQYSNDWVYISTHGIPAYPTGPFLDGNPSIAGDQNAIFRIPRNPQPNTGTPTATTPGNIGIFINGVALFDYRDGVAWNPNTNSLCGGPGNPPCPGGPTAVMDWNRDAVLAEKIGFDCSKGHPAMGNYHHHQNPTAFKLDIQVVSGICNLYDADGLYVIDPNQHAPLIGFAYDGYPIYGAFGYKNTDGTGGIARIKSSYQLKNINSRTNGPAVNATYYLGYFREDYEYIAHPNDPDYLDEHNGRFCITPEYPNGTYAYFATVDSNYNSAYPYVVGPTFYGIMGGSNVTSITEPVTTYTPTSTENVSLLENDIFISPNPAGEFIAIQYNGLTREKISIQLLDINGRILKTSSIEPGSTISYLDIQTLYDGIYMVHLSSGNNHSTKKIIVRRE